MDTTDPTDEIPAELLVVSIDRVATGGEGVGRLPNGQVVFVPDALPGERAEITLVEQSKRFARGHVVHLITTADTRVAVDCPHVAEGCGGCDWRHVRRGAQLGLKAGIVSDALIRIGRLVDPCVETAPAVSSLGRTVVRATVHEGRAGYRARKSHRRVIVESCRAAHPLVEEILVQGRFGAAEEVTIRVGARTGERMVMLRPGDVSTDEMVVPIDVKIVTTESLADGSTVTAWIYEEVGGRRWRIGAGSFFQSSPESAETIGELVKAAIATAAAGPLVDLYAGVGLLGGLARGDRSVTMVESSRSSVGDARINVPEAEVIQGRVERWAPTPAAAVIADPARSGLGASAVAVIAATGASRVVLVSCDAGSLGRDAGLLTQAGYSLDRATVVNMFPDTSHVEVVSVFDRA